MYEWQPIDTIPDGLHVDVWVASKNNPDWGVRITGVCKTDKHSLGWVGIEQAYLTDGIYPTYWMKVGKPEAL